MTFPALPPSNLNKDYALRSIQGPVTGFRFMGTVYYTDDGTFDKADYPGLKAVRVRLVGGGGAGGGANSTSGSQASVGSGGGGGGYSEKLILASELSASETVTVGAGGAGVSGNHGNHGNPSSFGSHCSATGGARGLTVTATGFAGQFGGVGGVGSGGDINIKGSGGGTAYTGTIDGTVRSLGLGFGGGSILGGGAMTQGANAEGAPYGGGGGGKNNNPGQPAQTGGAGGPGIVIVELYA